MTTQTGHSICSICDIGCQVRTESEDGRVTRVIAHYNPLLAKNICFKGVAAPNIHNAPDRLRVPLKRVGERGENRCRPSGYPIVTGNTVQLKPFRLASGVRERTDSAGLSVSGSEVTA